MVSGLGKALQSVTDPFSGRKQRKADFELTNQALDNLREDLAFSQAFAGIQLNRPFEEIEKTRTLAKRRSSEPGNLLATILGIGGKALKLGIGV